MGFARKFQEWVYTLLTRDKYSEFDSRNSFNRINKPSLYSHNNLLGTNLMAQEYEPLAATIEDGIHEVRLAWRHISNWINREYPDLLLTVQLKCTDADISDFQKDLEIVLPGCVKEFYKIVDGQFGQLPEVPGLIYGLKLCLLDDIVTLSLQWRKVAKILGENIPRQELAALTLSHSITSKHLRLDSGEIPTPTGSAMSLRYVSAATTKPEVFVSRKQRSIPPGYILEEFAHHMWIPLVTDGVGNCIGIDLAPGPDGKEGQVILFGRDFDDKFLIAPNWGDYLLSFANDLETGNWGIKGDAKAYDDNIYVGSEGELVFVDRVTKVEVPYFDVLRTRAVRQWIKSVPEPTGPEKKLMEEILRGGNSSKDLHSTLHRHNSTRVDRDIDANLANVGNHDVSVEEVEEEVIVPATVMEAEELTQIEL